MRMGLLPAPRAAGATLDETLAQYLLAQVALYGYNGADLSRLVVNSAANPELLVRPSANGTAASIVSGGGVGTVSATNFQQMRGLIQLISDAAGTDQVQVARGRELVDLLASEANTQANRTSATQTLLMGKGVIVVVNISAGQGTFAYDLKVQMDRGDGTFIDIWQASTALAADGNYAYILVPGAANGGGSGFTEHASIDIGHNWRFVLLATTASGGNDATTQAWAIPLV